MDLRQLNAVLAVADHGSFSAAARALHTVQSNVSTHVAHLERELGVELIDRATGHVTSEGEIVVARTRRIQAELEALAADVASARDQVTGTTHLGVIGTTARWLVAPLVRTMAARHPGVQVVIHDATTISLLLQLSSGAIDLAVLTLPVTDPDVQSEPLFDEDRLLLVPVGHPVGAAESLSMKDLAGIALLLEPPGTRFRDQLDALAAEAGVELSVLAEVDGTRLMASMVFERFGAAILPASAAPAIIADRWHRIPVDGVPGRSVGLARSRRGMLSAPTRALREVLLEVLADVGPRQTGVHLAPGD
jgi:DNA-binding transcriptional LysR family regulator